MCNGHKSKLRFINYGVPQGSNLGPLLFLLYVNDLPKSSSLLHFILFADDTNVFYSHRSLDHLMDLVTSELAAIANWFRANKLSLNVSKTNFIVFHSHRKSILNQRLVISIDNKAILQDKSAKFLGVYVDEHLTWKDHIAHISNKVAKNVGIFSRISYLLPRNTLNNLYYSLIHLYLIYCNIGWASNYLTRLRKLVILQKGAIRVVAGVFYNAHTKQIFKDLRILQIHQINEMERCVFRFRFENNLLPIAFRDFFTSVSDIHMHNTRTKDHYRTDFAHVYSRLNAVAQSHGTVWAHMHLPSDIRRSRIPSTYLKQQ